MHCLSFGLSREVDVESEHDIAQSNTYHGESRDQTGLSSQPFKEPRLQHLISDCHAPEHSDSHKVRAGEYVVLVNILLSLFRATSGSFSDRYYRQFQQEIHSVRRQRQVVLEGIDAALKRCAGAGFATSQGMITQWMPLLTEAIRKDQLAVSSAAS